MVVCLDTPCNCFCSTVPAPLQLRECWDLTHATDGGSTLLFSDSLDSSRMLSLPLAQNSEKENRLEGLSSGTRLGPSLFPHSDSSLLPSSQMTSLSSLGHRKIRHDWLYFSKSFYLILEPWLLKLQSQKCYSFIF